MEIEALTHLSEQFGKIDGIGRKTAMRMAYAVLGFSDEEAQEFADAIVEAKQRIHLCPVCQNLTDRDMCNICSDLDRDTSVICVVEDPRAVQSLEKVREYRGLYHVLHGVISPVNGITPDKLKLKELLHRLEGEVEEVIVATNPTVEGEATALYIARLIKPLGIRVTRLAHGIPMGADLEYADEITLYRALEGRREF